MRFVTVPTLLLVALSGCMPFQTPPPRDVTDRAETAQLARIDIPATATELHGRFVPGFQDDQIYGRFDIPAADLPALLRSWTERGFKVEPHTGQNINVLHLSAQEPWWRPAELRQAESLVGSDPGFAVNLLFGETTTAGVLRVYFHNFGL